MSKHDGFFDNHERNRSPKQGGRQDDFGSLQEEGDDGYEVFVEKPKGQSNGARIMNSRMVGRHGYEDRQRYRVKAQIPNFLGNLDLEAMLDWLYEVNKFFVIMDVPEEEEVNIVVYKISGGDGDWWQNVQENHKRQGKYPINTWPRMKRMINGRCDACPNRKLNAYVWENYGGDTEIDFGDDLEHIDKFAQVVGEVVNLMVQRASHLLLGRPWRHDVDAIHRGKNNSFFVFNWFGKNIAILLNGRPPDLKSLFVHLLVEDGENSRASSFQVRGNDRT
ncbi:hypothetical protein Tco_0890705 [Tanacetum coccineum]|uniref:Uncharacterized protein n=1 Tax=Tanacetum coccineum TaxID=301880 RepID=A0ABQ5C2F5_9ASTR